MGVGRFGMIPAFCFYGLSACAYLILIFKRRKHVAALSDLAFDGLVLSVRLWVCLGSQKKNWVD